MEVNQEEIYRFVNEIVFSFTSNEENQKAIEDLTVKQVKEVAKRSAFLHLRLLEEKKQKAEL